MNKGSFLVLIGDAYDGLEKTGEPVTMKAGHAAHDWVHRNIKSLPARKELDVRYRNSMVELDESLPPGVVVLSAGGESCTLVLTVAFEKPGDICRRGPRGTSLGGLKVHSRYQVLRPSGRT